MHLIEMLKINLLFLLVLLFLFGCENRNAIPEVEQWTTHEISLTSGRSFGNGYTDVDVWASFKNEKGDSLVRPAFWDGNNHWKIRFSAPDAASTWTWQTFSSVDDSGLSGKTGSLKTIPYRGNNPLLKNGLLKISPGKRNVMFSNGNPFLVVGDTPWALPYRATKEDAEVYAKDRQKKGFNAALLMTVQPDMEAEGPEERNTVNGFDVGFADLKDGTLNQLKPDYFQYLDTLRNILIDHGIVPVFQPVFHGFGWKGQKVLGVVANPEEYARFCKYLVARYGAAPAIWLIGADGTGREPGVGEGGEAVEKWDAYHQPAGIHYNPCDNYIAEWAQDETSKCMHYNKSFQDAGWLDFQWAQSGHDGKHLTYKVAEMYENKPTKAVLNGEPTYEGMGGGKYGLGWWQGHEAWIQLMHGGTMGVVYGAASLWQWKITADEPGWGDWASQKLSWRQAMELEGSNYVGAVSKAFDGFDFLDMEKRWDLTGNNQPLLANPGKFYVSYLEAGGKISIKDLPRGLSYFWFNPKRGTFEKEGIVEESSDFNAPDENPWVLLVGNKI